VGARGQKSHRQEAASTTRVVAQAVTEEAAVLAMLVGVAAVDLVAKSLAMSAGTAAKRGTGPSVQEEEEG
jgi:hypothetical protein